MSPPQKDEAARFEDIERATVFNFSIINDSEEGVGSYTHFASQNDWKELQRSVVYEINNAPISTLRNLGEMQKFCTQYKEKMKKIITSPFKVITAVSTESDVLQNFIVGHRAIRITSGVPLEEIDRLAICLRNLADSIWRSVLFELNLVFFSKFVTGLWPDELRDASRRAVLNREFSTELKYIEFNHEIAQAYHRLAKSCIDQGNLELAGSFCKVIQDISLNLPKIAPLLKEEAKKIETTQPDILTNWPELQRRKLDKIHDLHFTFSEGIAEWSSVTILRMIEDGIIEPIEDNLVSHSEYVPYDTVRKKILAYSASNPYRVGLESLECIENKIGAWLLLGPLITIVEFPMMFLAERIPVGILEEFSSTDYVAADWRLRKLVELCNQRSFSKSRDDIGGKLNAREIAHGTVKDIHSLLDADMPSLRECCMNALKRSEETFRQ